MLPCLLKVTSAGRLAAGGHTQQMLLLSPHSSGGVSASSCDITALRVSERLCVSLCGGNITAGFLSGSLRVAAGTNVAANWCCQRI